MAGTGPKLVTPDEDDTSLPLLFAQTPVAAAKIEYSAELIDEIRADAVNALLSLPHGGLEIAGVLYGKRTGRTIYLAARRVIDCEHASGPSLTLSPRDEQRLEELLALGHADPELEEFEPMGWYLTHTRRPFSLASSDVAIFDRFFPEPFQLTGLIEPQPAGAAQFGWFVRNLDGSVDQQRPTYDFTVHPCPGSPRPGSPPPRNAAEPEKLGDLVSLRGNEGSALALREVPEEEKFGMERWHAAYSRLGTELVAPNPVWEVRSNNFAWIAIGLLVLIFAATAVWWIRIQPPEAVPPPLHVVDTGTQLRIDWDSGSPFIQRARLGVLEIRDSLGKPVQVTLQPDMLRAGSVLYAKPSNKVEIHLKLTDEKGGRSESMVYFIGRELELKPPGITPLDNLARQTAALTAPPALPTPSKNLKDPRTEPPPTEPQSGSAERAAPRTFKPPVPKAAAGPEAAPLEAPRIGIPGGTPNVPLLASIRPEVAAPPPVVAGGAKTPNQPTSGRLIWTGDLHKNGVLHLTERGASTGSLNGRLPGRPVKVSVHSAELLDGAIAVYTSDENSTKRAEAPSRRGGWNVTLYKFDPKRAHDLNLIEAPAAANDWRQLRIKSIGHPVSMIVIDWQLSGN